MEAIGVRESNRQRLVGLLVLNEMISESGQYQDWRAKHTETGVERRIRIFPCKNKGEEAALMQRAARREAQVLEHMERPGILLVIDYQQHEPGPALIFEDDTS